MEDFRLSKLRTVDDLRAKEWFDVVLDEEVDEIANDKALYIIIGALEDCPLRVANSCANAEEVWDRLKRGITATGS